MFGLIQGVLLSPPPYADPDRLVLISPARTDGRPYTRGATIGQWLSWRQAKSIEPPAIYRWTFNFLVLPDGSESMGGMVVTPSYFTRARAAARSSAASSPTAELARPNTPPSAIILGYDLWQRKFNGDPQHRRTHDPDEPHAGAAARRRRHAAGHSVPARSRARRASPTTTSTRTSISGSASRPTNRGRPTARGTPSRG